MSALASFLPSTPGALPYFFLLTSAASIYNAAQNYFILWQTKEIYSAKAHEVSPLAARIFAMWTLVSAVIRGTAAYNVTNPTVYTLAISTYAIALWHFGSELLIFRSVKVNRASAGPLIVASVGLAWTLTQQEHYTR
ncbi:ergosterol biosynthesis protein [Saitozyma podzolica]|uniref:Ergosterol biosynthesis protein n=1 Tax=Saitozyma podzolica TaxID=1890683 RepID=A0A427YNV8_9TREE|nr:ergosterol biosynthesis protein [Saitozyma podzolica]